MEPSFLIKSELLLKELFKQSDSKFLRQNKYITLQKMNDCHSFFDKSRYLISKDGWPELKL